MSELGYEAKSHKLPQGKSLVLKSCEFIRSSWLMEDETCGPLEILLTRYPCDHYRPCPGAHMFSV